MVILLLATVAVAAPLSAISQPLGSLGGALLLGLFLYWQFQNGSCGQSPGKALLGLRVVGESTGQPIGGGKGLLRYLVATLMSVFTCGLLSAVDYLFPLWDKRRQTLHDKAVGSVVVANQPKRQLSELLKP